MEVMEVMDKNRLDWQLASRTTRDSGGGGRC